MLYSAWYEVVSLSFSQEERMYSERDGMGDVVPGQPVTHGSSIIVLQPESGGQPITLTSLEPYWNSNWRVGTKVSVVVSSVSP